MNHLVAFATPTMNRPDTHEALYVGFAAQSLRNKMLVVYDESREPSPFFSKLRDSRVDYVHAPVTTKREVTRIGAARNAITERVVGAGGAYMVACDDDDVYGPTHGEHLVDRIGDADVAKLAVFRLMVAKGEAAGTLWQWDVRQMGGRHYGLKGSETPQPADIEPGEDPVYAEATRFGYMFGWAWKTELSQRIPFPEEGTEDYPWLRECMANGARVVEVDDMAHESVHVVSPDSASMCWPQVALGKAQAGMGSPGRSLREFVRWRMLGAVSQMYELPIGQDIHAKPGVTYQVLSAIKQNHTLKSVVVRAQSWGLTVTASRDNVDPSEFGVPAPAKGYRLVHVVGTTSKPITIPWQGNKLIRKFDASSIVRAWSDQRPAAQINQQLQPAPAGMGAARALHGFGGGRCVRCVNYAWTPEMGPSMKAVDGSMHHPSCDALVGLADTKLGRMMQRRLHDRPDLAGVHATLGPKGRRDQINSQLTPRST